MLFKTVTRTILLLVIILNTACERDLNQQTATLTINNLTDLRVPPAVPLSIWSVYITPTNSLNPALDRSHDLLASVALKPGNNKTFTIDSCGQLLDIIVIFSDGSELTSPDANAAEINCNTVFILDVF